MAFEKIKELRIRRRQEAAGAKLSAADSHCLDAMFLSMERGDSRARPSRYWVELNKMNVAQLRQHGYENFKRTIALNYFTFARILPWDAQIRFLLRMLPTKTSLDCLKRALISQKHQYFSAFNWIQSVVYNFLTMASWAYTRAAVADPALLALREPQEGNPAEIRDGGEALISQDLANSILEISSMDLSLVPGSVVLELGAGYGRDAYAMLATQPGIKYIIVDIPPALWVAETYLRHQFPNRRVFSFREFSSFSEIEDEFRSCDIAFFLSTQIASLPNDIADLVVNISSLHEMRLDQINFYFFQFDRVLKDDGRFYFKQWKRGPVLFENVFISQEDYPVPPTWHCEMCREAPIQTAFFEALYRKPAKTPARNAASSLTDEPTSLDYSTKGQP